VAARGFTRRRRWRWQTRWTGAIFLFCLPTPAVKVTDTCNKGNNAQQQLILVLFFSFVLQICISLRSSVSFRFPFVPCFKRPAVWMCFGRRLCSCWCLVRRRWRRTKWSDRRLQLLCCCSLRSLELLRKCERLLAVLRRRNGQIGGCRCGGQLLWEGNAGGGCWWGKGCSVLRGKNRSGGEKETQGDRLVKGRRLAEQSATVGWERGTWWGRKIGRKMAGWGAAAPRERRNEGGRRPLWKELLLGLGFSFFVFFF